MKSRSKWLVALLIFLTLGVLGALLVGCTNKHLSYMYDYSGCRELQSKLNTGGYGYVPDMHEVRLHMSRCLDDMNRSRSDSR